MHYELNVSLNGKHFFATAPRSITDQWTAALMFTTFREKFPEADGYQVTCTLWESVGKHLSFDEVVAAAFEG